MEKDISKQPAEQLKQPAEPVGSTSLMLLAVVRFSLAAVPPPLRAPQQRPGAARSVQRAAQERTEATLEQPKAAQELPRAPQEKPGAAQERLRAAKVA